MTLKLIALIDYKGSFGSKYDAIPYNSGMDKVLLKKYFNYYGIDIEYIPFVDVNNYTPMYWEGKNVIYTSSEDKGYYYKSFIEDIIYYLKLCGAKIIPEFEFLRANNNKVFMELFRKISNDQSINNIFANVYGTLEEALKNEFYEYPVVFKSATGAMSEGVRLAKNRNELIKIIKKTSNTFNIKEYLWEFLRTIKYKGYIKESNYRDKFVLQKFIPNLKYDYKVLIFYDKYFVFRRPNRKNDFRASGSGNKHYIYGLDAKPSDKLLAFAHKVNKAFNTPTLSLDIAQFGDDYFLLEFQALYFGTVGVFKSPGYFIQDNDKWKYVKGYQKIEDLYSYSISKYIKNKLIK